MFNLLLLFNFVFHIRPTPGSVGLCHCGHYPDGATLCETRRCGQFSLVLLLSTVLTCSDTYSRHGLSCYPSDHSGPKYS